MRDDVSGPISGIDVHFDDATSGFFIKESAATHQQNSISVVEDGARTPDQNRSSTITNLDTSVQVEKFVSNLTVFGQHQMISIRASYGPFLTRQTIAASSIQGTGHKSGLDMSLCRYISESKQTVNKHSHTHSLLQIIQIVEILAAK